MKDGDRFIIHEFFVCEESKNAIVADFYIKKHGFTAALLSTRAKDGDAGSVVAGHCKDHFGSSVPALGNSRSDFKHALSQQPARIETTVES